jgi:hypothetical protein
VRTPMSCYICHSPDDGYIRPRNLIEEALKRGVDVKIRDKEKYERYLQLYTEWDGKLEGWRVPYKAMLAKLPRSKAGKVRTGLEMVTLMVRLRDQYDQPVTAEMAAAELGVDVESLKIVASVSPRIRLANLVLGDPIPRSVWEGSMYLEAVKLLYLPLKE